MKKVFKKYSNQIENLQSAWSMTYVRSYIFRNDNFFITWFCQLLTHSRSLVNFLLFFTLSKTAPVKKTKNAPHKEDRGKRKTDGDAVFRKLHKLSFTIKQQTRWKENKLANDMFAFFTIITLLVCWKHGLEYCIICSPLLVALFLQMCVYPHLSTFSEPHKMYLVRCIIRRNAYCCDGLLLSVMRCDGHHITGMLEVSLKIMLMKWKWWWD